MAELQIIIDSSVLRRTKGDLTLGDWPVIHAAARLGLFQIRLPATVLQELVDHRRRDLAQLIDMERKMAKQRDQLIPSTGPHEWRSERPAISEAQVDRLCFEYGRVVTQWVESVGTVLDDPRVSHKELVDRLLNRKRPFAEGERGYRDALIWYSTLECAAGGPTILLTANTRDFAQRDGDPPALAGDLVADLQQRGFPDDRVTLLTTTSALLQAVLPEWDDSVVRSAWAAYLSSEAGVGVLDSFVDVRLGLELTAPPPDAPRWLWSIGLRSVEAVESVDHIHAVPESDGWFRVHATAVCAGRIGGYAWAWGDPNADVDDFVLWDDWGGLTEYFAHSSPSTVDVVIAARFRPLVEVEDLDVVRVSLRSVPAKGGILDELSRVHRALEALLTMLSLHGDRPDFLTDVLGDNFGEFEMVVRGVLVEWEEVANAVPGRYSALAVDNLGTTLRDAAGLQALRRDLGQAALAIAEILAQAS